MSLAFPAALGLLALIPLYFVATRRARAAFVFPRAGVMPTGRWGRGIALLPTLFRVLCLIALVGAIAGPATAGPVLEERLEGVPIVISIDVSSSMLAQDFQPRDRLSVARTTTARFIESRPESDPIGIVIFAAEALTLVPATTHRAVTLASLESVRVGILEDGTAIGDGLATALNRLRALGDARGVVLLLSDGESNRGTVDPLAAAEAAAAMGVRVFTIGVGSEGVARAPVESGATGIRYAEVPVAVDEEMLREIADRTGGAYFRATDPAALDAIYQQISLTVPSVVETVRTEQRRIWAGPLLLVAGLLLAAEWMMRGSRFGVVP